VSAFVPELDLKSVPWNSLDAVSLRRKLLVNPETFFHVKTLDTMKMSPRDIYAVLELLLKGQESGVHLLKFSIEDTDTEEEVNEQEIDELLDPDQPTALRRDAGINAAELDRDPLSPWICKPDAVTCADSRRDKGDYIDGIGLQLPDPSLLLSVPATPAPVIGPASHSSPPPSESTIKAAIENIAKAGYLSISDATAIPSPNQALLPASQQSGKVKTGRSNSQKRKREEGGPNNDKKTKKQAVPIREQSSRYDVPNFFFLLY